MMTSTSKRTTPLAAGPAPSHDQASIDEIQVVDVPSTGDAEDLVASAPELDEHEAAVRDQRFAEGVRQLRVGGVGLRLDERILLVLGGIVAPLGIVVVLLGWWGAAHTPYVFEQLPYLISGGLLGIGLVFLGAFFYFAHWLTQLVKEHRAQSTAIVEALQRLQDQAAEQSRPSLVTAVPSNGSHPETVALVATARGTMAHRRDCVVVAGKEGLRSVEASDGLAPCKLCDPFA